jgi:hypothetical protein
MKALIILFMVIGSYVGSCFPLIWGDSLLSISSLLFSAVGGIFGIWAGYAIAQRIGIN